VNRAEERGSAHCPRPFACSCVVASAHSREHFGIATRVAYASSSPLLLVACVASITTCAPYRSGLMNGCAPMRTLRLCAQCAFARRAFSARPWAHESRTTDATGDPSSRVQPIRLILARAPP